MSFPIAFLESLPQYPTLGVRQQEIFKCVFGSSDFPSRQKIADHFNMSTSTLSTSLTPIFKNFHVPADLGPRKENYLRTYLSKEFQKWQRQQKDNSEITVDGPWSDIDALVKDLRGRIQPVIEARCGTMQVLDRTQEIGLEDIYTKVNILEKPTALKHSEMEELYLNFQSDGTELFDRIGFGKIREPGVDGLKVVRGHPRLIVLGKPGAGKTTFLKYLAMQSIQERDEDWNFSDCLPLFVILKEFAELETKIDLVEYLARVAKTDRVDVTRILDEGRAFVLLDGLDEVLEEDRKRVRKAIKGLAEYKQSHILVTCRSNADSYVFKGFTEVEVADFDELQIAAFVKKWFETKKQPKKSTQFLKRLDDAREGVKELANSPLLLMLLCLIFEEKGKFYRNRSDLYEQGVELLLEKWDDSRDIDRDEIYGNLSTKRRQDLLGKLALQTFRDGRYFFRRSDAEQLIERYFANLSGTDTQIDVLDVDSKKVLRSIQAQHGLLIERAVNIYSYSHLTFHEYFAAYEIVNSNLYNLLFPNMLRGGWREVHFLVFQMSRNKNGFIRNMKSQIDQIIRDDFKIQALLKSDHQRIQALEWQYSPSIIRLYHFWMLHHDSIPSFKIRDCSFYLLCSYGFAFIKNSFRCSGVYSSQIDFDNFPLFRNESFVENYIDFGQYLSLDRYLDLALALAKYTSVYVSKSLCDLESLSSPVDLDPVISGDIFEDLLSFAVKCSELRENIQKAFECTNQLGLEELLKSLSTLTHEVPDPHEFEDFLRGWQENGDRWTKELQTAMIEHRNIGHDWDFTKEQIQKLEQYFKANKLVVDCLNSDCSVSQEVRQEIEDTLLLPQVEIDRYYAERQ